mgnify:CR=1 FL=1
MTFRESTAHAVIGEVWRAASGLIDRSARARRCARTGGCSALTIALPQLHRPAPHQRFLRLRATVFRPGAPLAPVAGARRWAWPGDLCVLGMLAEPERPVRAAGGDRRCGRHLQVHPDRGSPARHRVGRRPAAPSHPPRGRAPCSSTSPASCAGSSAISRSAACWPGWRLPGRRRGRAAHRARALSGGGIRSATRVQPGRLAGAFGHASTSSGDSTTPARCRGRSVSALCLTPLLSHPEELVPPAGPAPGREAYTFVPGETPYFGTKAATLPFNPEVAEQATMREFNGQGRDPPPAHSWRLHHRETTASSRAKSLRAVGNLLGGLFYHLFLFALFLVGLAGTCMGGGGPHCGRRAPRGRPAGRRPTTCGRCSTWPLSGRDGRLSAAVGDRHRRRHHPW